VREIPRFREARVAWHVKTFKERSMAVEGGRMPLASAAIAAALPSTSSEDSRPAGGATGFGGASALALGVSWGEAAAFFHSPRNSAAAPALCRGYSSKESQLQPMIVDGIHRDGSGRLGAPCVPWLSEPPMEVCERVMPFARNSTAKLSCGTAAALLLLL